MSNAIQNLSLPELRNLLQATRRRLEDADNDPTIDKRSVYKELKALQYAIAMKEATMVAAREEA